MKRLKTFLCLFLFVKGILSACPDDWVQNGDSCYYVASKYGISLPWHEAQSKCESMAGMLVVIETETENNFLFSQLGDGTRNWIGLHDLYEEDTWQWVDETPLTYSAWNGGQPDNWQDAAASQEDCVEILQSAGGLWNDASCNLRLNFVCERSVNADPNPKCQVSEGWKDFENRCYRIIDDKVPWLSADQACKVLSANLVSITSNVEQLFVANEVNQRNEHIWIGLSSVGHSTNSLYWSSGEEFNDNSYTNWATDPPTLSPTADNCVEVDPSVTSNGPWGVERCGEGHSFMCETSQTGACAEGWRMFAGNCYFFGAAQNIWEKWITANDFCNAMGAKLLKIETLDQQNYITAHLPDFEDAGSSGVWLGISDKDVDGNFVWTDGESVAAGSYNNWGSNQPRDQANAWDCGEIFTGSSSGNWETSDCFKKQAFICQIPTGVDPTPINPPATPNKGCDPGWYGFKSHCYYFETVSPLLWQQAEDQCVAYGGHLVSVLDGEENAFVTGHVLDRTWLGGNDQRVEGTFVWSDNSPFEFADWEDGEPTPGGTNQNCVQLWVDRNYKWDDAGCENEKNYVCKKSAQDCWEPLGMEDGRIVDQEITASSSRGVGWEASEGRLNNVNDATAAGAWGPKVTEMDCGAVPPSSRLDCGLPGVSSIDCTNLGCCWDESVPNVPWCFDRGVAPQGGSEWIQVHLVPARKIAGITTQGRPADENEYVKSYQVSYSNDGTTFTYARNLAGSQTFTGNKDSNTPVTNKFQSSVVTSYVRLFPQDYNLFPSLRMEIVGCTETGDDLPTPSPHEGCTSIAADERLDCGFPGVTSEECLSKGCCWDHTQSGVNWCFYAKGDYDPKCGKDWEFDPGGELYCYHFNDYKQRSWQRAREYCQEIGGDLLSINSNAEQSYVNGRVANLVIMPALWIGANRIDETQGWKWSNGAPFNFFYWVDGEPNNQGGGEHCVEMYTWDSKWNDVPCEIEKGIACKKYADVTIPIVIASNLFSVNICEGESYVLGCAGSMIVIHHAAYGRSNALTCDSEQAVPVGGCNSEDTLGIVSEMCNDKETCTLSATNDVFGDPCNGVYKYLNVIYSCESKDCFEQLGIENGTISDSQISESSSIDNSHRGKDGRLNGPRSWATNEGIGAYVQVAFQSNIRVTGFWIQGASDAERYVTMFKVGFANDETFSEWTDYTNFDKVVVNFTGNSDSQTPVRVVLAEHVFTRGVRIYPLQWSGDMIGMRFEATGCFPLRELGCDEIGEVLLQVADPDGKVVQAECPGLCPFIAPPKVYGTGIYAGISQVCNAAIHAGVILEQLGGPVTLIKKPAQSIYRGTVKNEIPSVDHDYYPVAFSFTNNEKTCPLGWMSFSEYCYYFSDEQLSWSESEAMCDSMGGHLATIVNSHEQDFVAQQIVLGASEYVWIGLNDLHTFNDFEWVDGAPVLYTNWEPFAPDNWDGKQESCVEIHRETSMWNDYLCDDTGGYVCKKYKDYYTSDETDKPTPAPGCSDGWTAYDGYCYWFQRDLVTEAESEAYCAGLGGQNVHIRDRFVQSFLHTVVGSEDLRWWLGLHAHVTTDTGVDWEWESGDDVTYDNWAKGNPDINAGECTVMYGGIFGNGFWYSTRCDKQAYSICEVPRDGWTTPAITTPPPSGGCAWDWSTPDGDSGYCYKVISPAEVEYWDKKQAWDNARHQCLSYQADLVSIHNRQEELYVINLLTTSGAETQSFWVGLNNKGQSSWSWSDGSATEYLSWNVGAPSSTADNNCVAMKYEAAYGTGFWDNINCLQELEWVCKRSKNFDPEKPTDPPTGVPSPSCGSEADGTWLLYESMCYLFYEQSEVDFHDASAACQTLGGNLLSVHTQAESAFIANQVKQMTSEDRYWIGLREHGGVNGEYTWSDDTPVDFVNWNPGEPNDAFGIEQCVVLLKGSNGKWNDENCALDLSGYICKKYPGAPPNPPQPTQPLPGGCPANWLMYSNYCYQIHGEAPLCDPTADSDNLNCLSSWELANDQCATLIPGGSLVAVYNKYQNAFITAQSIRATHNLWIGMSDIQWGGGRYTWSNGDKVTYTNWNQGEPNHYNGEENCVELIHQAGSTTGRWNDLRCSSSLSYMCMVKKDASLSPGQEINNNRKCKSGWMQFDTVNGQHVCYYLDNTARAFDDAQQACQSMGASLASLQSLYDQAFITSYVKEQTVWLGMRLNPDTSEWFWIDNWPVWITNWGEGQPTSDMSKQCVLNKDSVFGSEWITEDCSKSYPYVCKISSESIPSTPATVQGYCLDATWKEYGGFCVKAFVTANGQNEAVSWDEAEYKCTTYGAHLASFASRSELEWALNWYNETESLWIGLRSNGQGGWSWIDERPLTFTYWNKGEPNGVGTEDEAEDCVEMYGNTGRWNDLICSSLKGYMCTARKALGTDSDGNIIFYTTPMPPEKHSAGGTNAGAIAGIVIGVLLIIILSVSIAFYCSRNKDAASKIAETASEIPTGFVNMLYSVTGNEAPATSKSSEAPPVHFEKSTGATVDDSNA